MDTSGDDSDSGDDGDDENSNLDGTESQDLGIDQNICGDYRTSNEDNGYPFGVSKPTFALCN
jgi:hypothetical protein